MYYWFDFINLLLTPLILIVLVCYCATEYRRLLARRYPKLYIAIVIPGTILHELSHAIFVLLFGMRITRISLWSGRIKGEQGYVEFQYPKHSVWSQVGLFFVGLGPLFMLLLVTIVIGLITNVTPTALDAHSLDSLINAISHAANWYWSQNTIWVLIAIVILPGIVPSTADLKLAMIGAIAFLGLSLALAWFGHVTSLYNSWVTVLYQVQAWLVWSLVLTLLGAFVLLCATYIVSILVPVSWFKRA
ncbi:hypothetical protein [Vibrio mediterranei]|uniref:Integral membrane protein n=1 Tax=Vibrio mediterranei TaxID=689 RepID=A0ABX5D7C0_9VIBR|nr:hypothetical protein [Vibrio mediterranei]MCG9660892.1 hypothetical protein [Vibrio mediterranei]PRQ65163.1 hypothetical protein COR51_23875 [Vibrio mediterranei]